MSQNKKIIEVVLSDLQRAELVASYLAQPENLTTPDSEEIRVILCEAAVKSLHSAMQNVRLLESEDQ